MSTYIIEKKDLISKRPLTVTKSKFDSFTPNILGLGDIAAPSKSMEAICTIVDLGGFTDFSKQIDPHHVVPRFLSEFLNWTFEKLRSELLEAEEGENVKLFCRPPFFTKFMGDGLLLLWDASELSYQQSHNLVTTMYNVCALGYKREFLPKIVGKYSDPPTHLRCGIARGQVFSVGNGQDYVGACINMAARLQKLGPFNFAVSARGFLPDSSVKSTWHELMTTVQTEIRGIGKNELVYVSKGEYQRLEAPDKPKFVEVK